MSSLQPQKEQQMKKLIVLAILALSLSACGKKEGPYEFECKDVSTDVVVYNVGHVTMAYPEPRNPSVWRVEQENGHAESFHQPTGWTCYWQAVR